MWCLSTVNFITFVRELTSVMHVSMSKTGHTALLSVQHPSMPMPAASVCRVIPTALSRPAVPDRWTLWVPAHVTLVLWYTSTMSMVSRQWDVCELRQNVVMVSTVGLFLCICVDPALENWQVLFDVISLLVDELCASSAVCRYLAWLAVILDKCAGCWTEKEKTGCSSMVARWWYANGIDYCSE